MSQISRTAGCKEVLLVASSRHRPYPRIGSRYRRQSRKGEDEMPSKNVKTVLSQYDAFNKRDYEAGAAPYADQFTSTDYGSGQTLKSREEVIAWQKEWVKSASDAKVTEINPIDAGDTVVVQFVGVGTNDGPFGPYPATGRRFSTSFCNVERFDSKGRVVSDELYYDTMSILVQLGHVEAPPSA